MIKVKRPDGTIIETTEKAWQVVYSQLRGYRRADAEADDPQPSQPDERPLERLNKEQLTARAAELGVEVPSGATNKQIIEAIKAKLATEAPTEPPAPTDTQAQ